MINYPLKEHLSYYFKETDSVLKEKFYRSVLFQIFEQYFEIILRKYRVNPEGMNFDELKQQLHVHAFKNLKKIKKAAKSDAFLVVISKNYVINYLRNLNANQVIDINEGIKTT